MTLVMTALVMTSPSEAGSGRALMSDDSYRDIKVITKEVITNVIDSYRDFKAAACSILPLRPASGYSVMSKEQLVLHMAPSCLVALRGLGDASSH
jgi:hypothetical protein